MTKDTWKRACYFWITFFFGVVSSNQKFSLKPVDTEAVEGEDVELQCQVVNQVGAVQWSKDGFLLGFDPMIPGYPRHTMHVDESKGIYNLRIHKVLLEDDGEYQCQVGPADGQEPIREVARLTVYVPPHMVSIEGYQNRSLARVRPAEKLVLTCKAIRSKPYTRLRWFRKNIELLQEASRTTIEKPTPKLFTTHSTIVLFPKLEDDGVTYSCEAVHPSLKHPIRTSVTISIMTPPGQPEIEGFKEDEILHVGSTVSLSCISRRGNPSPRLIWYKNGVAVDHSYTATMNESINVLTFTVEPSDNNAVYQCEAFNNVSSKPLSTIINLKVLYPPERLMIDAPLEAKKGDTISLVCTSTPCNPAVKLSWAVDGVPVQAGDMAVKARKEGWISISTLIITLTRQDPDTKVFTCYAKGPLLYKPISETVKLNVLYPPSPPSILGFESGTAFQVNDLLRVDCVCLGGNPPATLQWMKGNQLIETESKMTGRGVTNRLSVYVQPSDNNATYRCRAKSPALDEPMETSITLYVLFPPDNVTIKVHPFPPKAGQMLNAMCTTSPSNPAALITWWKDGTLVGDHLEDVAVGPRNTRIVRSYVTLNVSAEDDGKVLMCEARNPLWPRSVRNDTWLSVFYKPEFTPKKMDISIVEGEVWKIHFNLRANPPVKSLKWSKDDDLVPVASLEGALATPFESPYRVLADGLVLHLVRISRHDAGVYACEAVNDEGSSRALVFLDVLYPATVTSVTKFVIATEGSDADLQCFTDGNPLTADDTIWRRANFDMATRTHVSKIKGQSILTVFNVTRDDAGAFECVAFNSLGEESVDKATLLVYFKPSILRSESKPKTASSTRDTAVLSCIAEGVPDVTFVWYAGASVISQDTRDSKYEHVTKSVGRGRWKSALLVHRVTEEDYGQYSCVARNDLGFDVIKTELVRKSVPDAPLSFEVLNVTQTSIDLRWTFGFDGGYSQYARIRYKSIAESKLYIQEFMPNVTGGTISNLQPSTEYVFTVTAINELGESQECHHVVHIKTEDRPLGGSAVTTAKGTNRPSHKAKLYRTVGGALGTAGLIISALIVGCICRKKYRNSAIITETMICELNQVESVVEENVMTKAQERSSSPVLYYISEPKKIGSNDSQPESIEMQESSEFTEKPQKS